jgi:hypothetical protein
VFSEADSGCCDPRWCAFSEATPRVYFKEAWFSEVGRISLPLRDQEWERARTRTRLLPPFPSMSGRRSRITSASIRALAGVLQAGGSAGARVPRNPGNSASCPRCSWRPQSGSFVAGPRFPARPTGTLPLGGVIQQRLPVSRAGDPLRLPARASRAPSDLRRSAEEAASAADWCLPTGARPRGLEILGTIAAASAVRSAGGNHRAGLGSWRCRSTPFAHGGVAAALREERHSLALEAK